MNVPPSTVEQIQKALAPVADKLGQGAQYAWSSYYRQTIIEATIQIVVAALLLVVVAVLATVAFTQGRKAYRSRIAERHATYFTTEESFRTGVSVIGGFVSAILLLVAGTMLGTSVPHLINPGYYTIQRLLEQFVH